MNNKLVAAIAFVGGVAVGGVAAWKLLTSQIEAKYKAIAEEEIESVKETFSRLRDKPSVIEVKPEQINDTDSKTTLGNLKWTREKPNITEYASIVHDLGYTSSEEDNKEKGKEVVEQPYVISPDEYGEMHGYESHTLSYYADGVLADEYDEVVENAEVLIGVDSLDHFGDYEEDAVHVRNDALMSDYEILREPRNYSDITFKPPHLVD